MALPTTIASIAVLSGRHPPFKSSSGNFYAIANTTTTTIDVYKATDPTVSWTAQDTSNNPLGDGFVDFDIITAVQDGDLIHIATDDDVFGGYLYHKFDMSSDTWTVTDEVIEFTTDAPENTWISIAVRSDGDVIVAYVGDTDRVMGGDKERVDYARRESGSWTVGVALDAAGDIHYGNPNVVKASSTDDMHFVWQRQTDTADPPTSWEDHEGRTLDSSNTLSTTDNEATALTSGHLRGFQNMVSYDDGGTERIIGSGPDTNQDLINTQATEDGSDDISITAPVTEALTDEIFVNGEVGIITTAELSGDLHILYSGGGANGVDQDLFYSTSTDNGASWATEAEEIDAVTVNFISANIYVRCKDTVLAYVYDDGGVQKYNEKVLIVGQTHQMML